MDIFSMLKNMDKDTLEQSLKQAQAFLSTSEGMDAAKNLANGQMPDGSEIPEDLKDVAKTISRDKGAQSLLGEFLKKKGTHLP